MMSLEHEVTFHPDYSIHVYLLPIISSPERSKIQIFLKNNDTILLQNFSRASSVFLSSYPYSPLLYIYFHNQKFKIIHRSAMLLLLLLLLSLFRHVRLCATPQTAAHQAPLSLGFSRQEHWSGLPFPSPMHESEKRKRSRSVMSNSSPSHGLQTTRLFRPRDFPGKSTGVGCHFLLQDLP